MLLIYGAIFSQEITVRFTGQLNGTNYCRLDRVEITNLTRDWTETIEYPDTIIVLGGTVGTNINISTAQGLGQNIPNPFDCETRVELSVSQRENVRMQLLDVAGKVYAQYTGSLDAGVHAFDISAANPQTYLLNAMVGKHQYSIRMVNVGSGCESSIRYDGSTGGIEAKLTTVNEFHIGDNMRYVGYATIGGEQITSEAVVQPQFVNQYITLQFIQSGSPIVQTLAATNVTSNSALLNGNIISGEGITTRGFFYGTSADNLENNAISNSTTNDFTVSITGLSDSTTYYYCAYATNSIGSTIGEVMTFTTLSQCECGGSVTVTDIDGNEYGTVLIGEQCWMAENLKTTRYANGRSIPAGSTVVSNRAYRYAPNDNSINVYTYGYLYNWTAATDGSSSTANPSNVQGACPTGWHMPSTAEWTQLTDYLSSQSEYQCGDTTTNIAKSLASTTGWSSSNTTCAVGNTPADNNSTGFGALPAGYYNGSYSDFGQKAYFWTATGWTATYVDLFCMRKLAYNGSKVVSGYGGSDLRGKAMSVRCVRD